ncbi:hypothetical protein ACL02U_20685 [Streptomyces sp. MS06]|uniref:hypothetical protein n=1 Tax=Streptomyces sp. MS06 TaxID=3385974 RepID=UPI0039A20687
MHASTVRACRGVRSGPQGEAVPLLTAYGAVPHTAAVVRTPGGLTGIDGKDLPVRVQQTGGGMSVTMDFLKFGATKPIEAPPAGDVGDLTQQVRKQRDKALGR